MLTRVYDQLVLRGCKVQRASGFGWWQGKGGVLIARVNGSGSLGIAGVRVEIL